MFRGRLFSSEMENCVPIRNVNSEPVLSGWMQRTSWLMSISNEITCDSTSQQCLNIRGHDQLEDDNHYRVTVSSYLSLSLSNVMENNLSCPRDILALKMIEANWHNTQLYHWQAMQPTNQMNRQT